MSKKPEIKPTDNEIEYVTEWYGIKKAAEIADDLEISVNRVYNICRFIGFKHLNRNFLIMYDQEQIILGGILGDGNIKRNGSNYYYRESHSEKEKEYCYWKFKMLENLASKRGFGISDKRDGQYGFQTINSPAFKKYKKMSKSEVIDNLDILGALVYFLDDGWMKSTGFCLSTGILDENERELLKAKLDKLFRIDCHLIGNETLSVTKKDIIKLIKAFKKYIPHNIDVYRKKVQPLIDKFKV